jgi:hypothetical protein
MILFKTQSRIEKALHVSFCNHSMPLQAYLEGLSGRVRPQTGFNSTAQ